MAITLAQIRTALAAQNGESSTPNDSLRDTLIQRTVDDIYYRASWSWRRDTASVAFNASGVGTAPADFGVDSFPLSDGTNNEHGEAIDSSNTIWTPISYFDRNNYNSGVIWVAGNEVDGYTFNIKETTSPTLSITYYVKADSLTSASDTTRIPIIDPIAKGAYARLVKPRDIDRINSGEQTDYEREVQKLFALERKNTPSIRLISQSEKVGHYLGHL